MRKERVKAVTFEDRFFCGEVRDGFYVEEEMKHAWAAEMEVLAEIDKICTENSIQYFADAGTLLGAVRHQGFIPWDDDIDICMKREDYEKFIRIAQEKLPRGWILLNPFLSDESMWDSDFSRVVNSERVCFDKEHMERFHNFPYPVGIDIYVLDCLPEDEDEEEMLWMICRYLYAAIYISKREELEESTIESIEELCGCRIERGKGVLNQLCRLSDMVCRSYWKNDAARLMMSMRGLDKKKRRICNAEVFQSSIRVPFENMTVPIPIGYKEVLGLIYGEDYMKPVQGTAKHDYPFYNRWENAENFKGEYKEGFFVEGKMKQSWAGRLVLLREIDRICKLYHIQYFVSHGTLLGTVRHQGFIPWDDDIDITMKREDYQHFIQIAPAELPEGWVLRSVYTDADYQEAFARVQNGIGYDLSKEHLEQFCGCPYVLGVDIFPLDYLPDSEEEKDVLYLLLDSCFSVRRKEGEERESLLQEIEHLLNIKIDRNGNINNQCLMLMQRLGSMYKETESEELGHIMNQSNINHKIIHKKEWWSKELQMPFEGMMVPVPIGYDNILRKKYGDDWRIPKYGTAKHEYPFYKKQDVELEKFKHGIVIAVTCDKLEKQENILFQLKRLQIPNGFRIQVVIVRADKDRKDAYNRIIRVCNARYKLYIGSDIGTIGTDFLIELLALFETSSETGMICSSNPQIFMATQYDFLWKDDEETQRKEFEQRGYKVVVMDDVESDGKGVSL